MNRPLSFFVAFALCVPASPVGAQLLSLRTVPLASGNQFLTYPMDRGGMGGLTIAISDRLADPFLNPALGKDIDRSIIGGAPVFYGFDVGDRAGRTLPVTALIRGSTWFGGGAIALQQLRHEAQSLAIPCCFGGWAPGELLSDRSSTNLYGQALLGRRFADRRWAWGVGLAVAGLGAVDGVELLYAGSQRIVQDGSTVTGRIGVAGTLSGSDQLEVTAVVRRLRMRHDVTYMDWFWRDDLRQDIPEIQPRLERNLDRTDTWGLDGRYRRPLAGTDWTFGTLFTFNYKDHPKIPNYEIMNIPRDPGTSWAYNIGFGMAHETDANTFGLDVILEPAWSNTWADALDPIRRPDGSLVLPGEKTIENDFTFLNAKMQVGFEQRYDVLALQLGLGLHSYDYDLTQLDRVDLTIRDLSESWVEWSPSWGLRVDLEGATINYAGWAVLGAGAPGTVPDRVFAAEDALASSDILIAASGPLTLRDIRVTTHQVSVTVPLR